MVALQDDRWLLLVAAGLLIAGIGGLAWMASDASGPRPADASVTDRSQWQALGQGLLVIGGIAAAVPAFRLGTTLDRVAGTDRYEVRGTTVASALGVGLTAIVIASLVGIWEGGAFLALALGAIGIGVGALAMPWLVMGVVEVAGCRRARATTWMAVGVASVGGLLGVLDLVPDEVGWGLLLGPPALLLAAALLDAWWNGFD